VKGHDFSRADKACVREAASAAEVEQGGSNSVVESQPSKLRRFAGVEPAAEILSGAKDLGKV
jgi:hypothetical protein